MEWQFFWVFTSWLLNKNEKIYLSVSLQLCKVYNKFNFKITSFGIIQQCEMYLITVPYFFDRAKLKKYCSLLVILTVRLDNMKSIKYSCNAIFICLQWKFQSSC